MAADLHQDFRRAVDGPDDRIDLGRAALLVAAAEYPNLDIGYYLSRLDQMAASVEKRSDDDADPYRSIAALNYVLFKELGFQGNTAEYYDPKNSFLNDVIERRCGIPITLSVLYLEVARRTGLLLHGVGFPGHFLVKYSDEDGEIAIDPFNGGEIRSVESLKKLLQDLSGGKMAFHPDFLAPATKRQILRRMLNNLKGIYLQKSDFSKSLAVIERLLILEPDSAPDLRDRGLIYFKLECFKQALNDLKTYLTLTPDAADADAVKEQIVSLQKRVTQIH